MPRHRLALCALALVLAAPAGAAADECSPWSGEPFPLPSVSDPNPSRARWAELRAQELALRAQRVEAEDPGESLRLWRRILCLDPQHAPAWRGVARTRPVRIHRPEVAWGARRHAWVRDPWLDLGAALHVPAPGPPTPVLSAAQRATLDRAQGLLVASESHLAAARFQEALAEARAAREALAGVPPDRGAPALRVRADVAAATAHVALGDGEAARASFGRALATDPRLRLDPARTSPKVIEALEAVRAGAGATP